MVCAFSNNSYRMTKTTVYTWLSKKLAGRGAQAELARYLGIDSPKLWRSLNGERKFKPDEVLKIAQYFNITTEEVMTGKPSKKDQANIASINQGGEGVMAAIEVVISALTTKGNTADNLDILFTHQLREFRKRNQSDEALVMDRLLRFLHFGLPQKALPATRKSSQPLSDQSLEQKT